MSRNTAKKLQRKCGHCYRRACREAQQGAEQCDICKLQDWLRNYHLDHSDAFNLFNEFLEMGEQTLLCQLLHMKENLVTDSVSLSHAKALQKQWSKVKKKKRQTTKERKKRKPTCTFRIVVPIDLMILNPVLNRMRIFSFPWCLIPYDFVLNKLNYLINKYY